MKVEIEQGVVNSEMHRQEYRRSTFRAGDGAARWAAQLTLLNGLGDIFRTGKGSL
jgi:hypothetical protein